MSRAIASAIVAAIASLASLAAITAIIAIMAGATGCTAARADDAVVVLWHAYAGDERRTLEEVTRQINDDFAAAGKDLRIKLVSVPYDAFADKISNAVPNGNGPDLFIFAHDRIGDWVATGLVEPVEYYVDEALADRFAYDAIAAMAYRRSLYGLPLAVKSVALFYRTDLVDAPPRDTDALMTWGGEFSGGGRYALAYENTDLYGHAAWLHGFGGGVFGPGEAAGEAAGGAGGASAGDASDREARVDVATAEAIAAATFARELGRLVPPEITQTMVATLFNEGKVALAISGPWFLADIAKDVPWGVTTLPTVSATGRPAAPFLGAEGVLMSARARDKDRAFQAMDALTGDASAILRARAARQVVPNKRAYDEPDIGGDAVLSAFRAQLEQSVPMPASPAMRMVWTPYKTALQNIIAQGANPADALAAAQREINGYLQGAR